MITKEHLARLPIFPLRGATLFPHVLLPLHIFEPRYREMMADCLRDERPMAIAMLRDEEPAGGKGPAVHDVLGVGVIAQHEKLPDGRYNLVLRGTMRARLVREWPQVHAYREVEAEPLVDHVSDYAVVARTMETLRGCLHAIQRARPELAAALAQMAPLDGAPGIVSDRLASTLFPEPLLRQELLGELEVGTRLDRVLGRAGELLARLGPSDPQLPN